MWYVGFLGFVRVRWLVGCWRWCVWCWLLVFGVEGRFVWCFGWCCWEELRFCFEVCLGVWGCFGVGSVVLEGCFWFVGLGCFVCCGVFC